MSYPTPEARKVAVKLLEGVATRPERGLLHLKTRVTRRLTAIITPEDSLHVALCPELDVVSQGETVEQAKANLAEALELFFECADPTEVERRWSGESFIAHVEVEVA